MSEQQGLTQFEIERTFKILDLDTEEQRRKASFRDLRDLLPKQPEPRFIGRASNTSEEFEFNPCLDTAPESLKRALRELKGALNQLSPEQRKEVLKKDWEKTREMWMQNPPDYHGILAASGVDEGIS